MDLHGVGRLTLVPSGTSKGRGSISYHPIEPILFSNLSIPGFIYSLLTSREGFN